MGDANQAAVDAFIDGLRAGDIKAMSQTLERYAHDDLVQEWPQSGERIRGKETVRRINESYPSATGLTPTISLRRVSGEGDTRVVEGTIDYGDGTPVSYVGIAEFVDGKVAKMTEYFANPFEAPEWRKQFVEKMEPVGAR